MPTKITLYYANWCGHCQRFKPVWEELKKELKALNVESAEYEDGQNKKEIEKAGVNGFPTIRITKNGNTYEYQGPRTVDALIKELTDPNVGTGKPVSVQTGGANHSDALYKEKYLKYKAKYMKLKALYE